MKKIIVILSLILCNLNQAKTIKDSAYIAPNSFSRFDFDEDCDACGCAAGNGSSGFESLLNPQFVGIKYFAQHYKAKKTYL